MPSSKDLREEAWRCLDAAERASEPEFKWKLSQKALELARLAEAVSTPDDLDACARSKPYRMYFICQGRVVGSCDLDAESEATAMVFAGALHEACSDVYEDFELWQGTNRIVGNAAARGWAWPVNPQQISLATQERILDREEALLSSRHALARSQRLLEATARLREYVARQRVQISL